MKFKMARTVWSIDLCALILASFVSRHVFGQANVPEIQTSPPVWPTLGEFVTSNRGWLTVSEMNLSDQERKDAESIMTPWMAMHCPPVTGYENRKRIASVSAERIQLETKASGQLAVTEMGDWEGDSSSCPCSRNLNCHIWVLNLSGDRATTLFESSGVGLVVLKSSSHGFYDIVTASNVRLGLIELEEWRFDGERYALTRCASKRYSRSVTNGGVPIDTGKVSEHPCKPIS